MPIFKVTFRGEHLKLRFGDEGIQCNFLKAEYVLAKDFDHAVVKAERRMAKQLKQFDVSAKPVVESVNVGHSFLRLFVREGFVLFWDGNVFKA